MSIMRAESVPRNPNVQVIRVRNQLA